MIRKAANAVCPIQLSVLAGFSLQNVTRFRQPAMLSLQILLVIPFRMDTIKYFW